MATLYSDPDNFRAQKILAAAAFGDLKVTVKRGEPPAAKFPFRQLPALETKGKAVSGDAGILWEVAASELKGQKKEDEAGVVAWLSAAEAEWSPAVLGWVLPSLSLLKLEKRCLDSAKAQCLQLLKGLDAFLLGHTFLVGERLSLADLSLAFNLLPAFQHVLDEPARKAHQNVTRWFNTVLGQPKVQAVVGKVSLCSVPATFDQKKFNEHEPKNADKGGKKEGKKGKKEAAPKATAPAEAMDDDEEEKPVKKSDPFDQFPKAAFNMDEFKRVYSNEDTLTKALPYLHEHMDWENHSVWYSEYKYPEDLGMVFMSCNLMGGMMQRLDKLRKNCFASLCLFGDNNASTISGVWIWRGPELAFTLSPDWQIDYESYQWTKLDPKDPKTKTVIQEYLTWEGDFGGKVFAQGKIFK